MMAIAAALLFAATRTWTGAAGTAWSNPANWNGGVPQNGDDVVFAGNTTSINDLPAGLQLHSITAGGGTHLSGNDIALAAGGLFTSGPRVSILNISLGFSSVTLAESQSWTSPVLSAFTGVGPTNVNGKTLTLNIAPSLTIQSISGAGGIVQKSGGTSINTSTYSGSITVDGGSLNFAGTAGSARVESGELDLHDASTGDLAWIASRAGATRCALANVHVTGSVALGNARLNITGAPPNIVIDNDGIDPIDGTFMGLPEGAVANSTLGSFRISYMGGDGNDVTLTAAPHADDTQTSLSVHGGAFVATVTASRGSVSFYDGGVLLGTSALDASGRASLAAALPSGVHAVTAAYTGTPSLATSQATLTVTVANRIRAVRPSSR